MYTPPPRYRRQEVPADEKEKKHFVKLLASGNPFFPISILFICSAQLLFFSPTGLNWNATTEKYQPAPITSPKCEIELATSCSHAINNLKGGPRDDVIAGFLRPTHAMLASCRGPYTEINNFPRTKRGISIKIDDFSISYPKLYNIIFIPPSTDNQGRYQRKGIVLTHKLNRFIIYIYIHIFIFYLLFSTRINGLLVDYNRRPALPYRIIILSSL